MTKNRPLPTLSYALQQTIIRIFCIKAKVFNALSVSLCFGTAYAMYWHDLKLNALV